MRMIARLPTSPAQDLRQPETRIEQSTRTLYVRFLSALKNAGFSGEIDDTHGTRTVLATDNSIYQRHPRAAVFPRDTTDVQRLADLLGKPEYRQVSVAARGGGTGTNGQSLTDGIVVDLSRHMNSIIEIDPVARVVRVQAGVVKDQLNAALRPLGLFFAPELSTSNRATIGGMINTDASGQGSCTYGKTRDHVLALDTVLIGGARLSTCPIDADQLAAESARDDHIGILYRTAVDIADQNAGLIRERFPKLNRCLTGYDLAHLRRDDGLFDLNSLLCGSEGTLGFVVEATLNVLPMPTFAMLVNIQYAGFLDALRDAQALMSLAPLSIETVDSTVLQLAKRDFVWQSVAEFFPDPAGEVPALGINLVEFSGNDPASVKAAVTDFVSHIQTDDSVVRLGHTLAVGHEAINRVYAMRKRSVGLLGNVAGEVRPQPFVEDTAVPPENLAAYIAEFRDLLDSHGLQYGMFGHVDAGVLHVRPALNMRDPAYAALVRPISDAVADLTQKYGGLLWGEHGKGVRSEYVPQFFGPLYPCLQKIKAAFDPFNQLNPGKIATPSHAAQPLSGVSGASEALGAAEASAPQVHTIALLRIDEVTRRGDIDRRIDERVWARYGPRFGGAVHCNGNGACYNFDPDDAMCPSWKATRDRVHSPKGRASLMREWLRLQGESGADVLALGETPHHAAHGRFSEKLTAAMHWLERARNTIRAWQGESDFSHEVYDAMAGCLACKSCSGQCPVKVSVPEFRSRFLALYHTRYLRPIRDYVIGSLEFSMPYVAAIPGMPLLYNATVNAWPVKAILARYLGMVDSPSFNRSPWSAPLRKSGARGCIAGSPFTTARDVTALCAELAALSPAQRHRSIVVVLDAFTRYFETRVTTAFVELAGRLGYAVYLAPFLPSGKPLHVQGFISAFERTARRTGEALGALSRSGVRLIGVDPAMTLVYRQEYLKVPGLDSMPDVSLPQEWLRDVLPDRISDSSTIPAAGTDFAFRLLPHCTERTNAPTSTAAWRDVFCKAGASIEIPASGCCGMSGTYGHEARNVETSKKIFESSWATHVASNGHEQELLATGYSCRSQTARLTGKRLRHPIEALLDLYPR